MEPRARRHQLREHLDRARTALDGGDREAALAAIARALELDPDYLAAQALREHITRLPTGARVADAASAPAAAPEPGASADDPTARWSQFEQRARARRIEKRTGAARAALASGRLRDARAAIAEIAGIDPQLPEYLRLLTELEACAAREQRRRRSPIGPIVAAVAVFCGSILVARYAGSPRVSAPPPAAMQQPPRGAELVDAAVPPLPGTVEAAQVVDAHTAMPSTPGLSTRPEPASTTSAARPVFTSGTSNPPSASPAPDTGRPPVAQPLPAEPPSADLPNPAPQQVAPIEPSSPAQPPGLLPTPPQGTRALPVERGTDVVSVSRPIAIAPVPATPVVRDEDLVLRTLQQYRRAYDTLDARAAQAVWPGVDSTALQRAFDGLVSQRLTFQSCQLQVYGVSASAACRGIAHFTPRIGSREPRDEPRDWRFTLRRTANDEWQIESARVAR